jgi:hydroxypyruvate isomerase
MKKSVCIEMLFTEVPFEDRFGLAKGSGFDYIEFWSWKEKDIQKIKELCQVYDLKIASFSGDQDFSMVDENQKEDYIAFVQESIEIAKLLDCNNLVIHSNALGENGVVINHYPNIAQTNKIAAMLDVLKTLAMEAEKSNVTLVLEALNTMVDHSGNFLASTREAAELIKSVNSSYIKILYDVYHMQIMEGNIINTLKAYIDVIGYIHIADVPGRHEPGTGEINFSNIMKTLKKLKYDGIIGFELVPLHNSTKAARNILAL